jgi:hypothetical protein
VLNKLHGEITEIKNQRNNSQDLKQVEEIEQTISCYTERSSFELNNPSYMNSVIKKPDLPKLNIMPRLSLSSQPVDNAIKFNTSQISPTKDFGSISQKDSGNGKIILTFSY